MPNLEYSEVRVVRVDAFVIFPAALPPARLRAVLLVADRPLVSAFGKVPEILTALGTANRLVPNFDVSTADSHREGRPVATPHHLIAVSF